MDLTPSLLCVFDGDDARQLSCFAGNDDTWIDRTDHGRCRYRSAAMDADQPDTGFMHAVAAVVVVRPTLLDQLRGERLRLWLAALEDQRIPVDLLATDAPVTFYAWLNHHAPRLLRSFRQDGEVRTALPSWWRSFAEHHLANPDSHGNAEDESSTSQFSSEQVKRWLATRNRR